MKLQKHKNKIDKETKRIINHLKTNLKHIKKASLIGDKIIKTLKLKKFVEFKTPIITCGTREYGDPIAEVVVEKSKKRAFLRQSPQFEKQLIVLSTKEKYYQQAPSVRPGEIDNIHIPYLHQIDIEAPFSRNIPYEEAQVELIDVIEKSIKKSLTSVGFKFLPTIYLDYREALKKFGTESPYFKSSKNHLRLAVIKNPPLFKKLKKTIDSTILPMAQPIWKSKKEENLFMQGKLPQKDIENICVYGYDFVISSPKFYKFKNKKGEKIHEALEIAGGSVRISNPNLQFKILNIVRKKYITSFNPLISVLRNFENKGIYSAGGAIGAERIAMIGTGVVNINETIPIPWQKNGLPPFIF